MPKRQSTAAQKARRRQAEIGEKYTRALRAQGPGPIRFRPFSAEGAGWAPIIERAGHRLREISPEFRHPWWGEKFGELRWEGLRKVPFEAIPSEAWRVIRQAVRESSVTCQTCPSPGRKRVVWTWDAEYGWVMPWVKTCCDACYHLPPGAQEDRRHQDLAEQYEDPQPELERCCLPMEGVATAVRAEFDLGGMPALLAKLEELHESLWWRSPHYDVFGGHAVVLAVQQACGPLFHQVPVSVTERRQVRQTIERMSDVLQAMVEEEHLD